MINSEVSRVLGKIPLLQHFQNVNMDTLPMGDWFLYETSPLPKEDELETVLSDIINDRMVHVSENGQLSHYKHCTCLQHILPDNVKSVIKYLSNQKFRVAVWEGKYGLYSNQPIFIAFDPEISFLTYPEHPHLNACVLKGSPYKENYIPDSICYLTDHDSTISKSDRIIESFALVSIWLFRHQVWELINETENKQWIGPQEVNPIGIDFTRYYNPFEICRCGSKKKYCECHMESDYEKAYPGRKLIKLKYAESWKKYRMDPQINGINQLSRIYTQ